MLHLEGHLSYIDKFARLKFTFDKDTDTARKLSNLSTRDDSHHYPFTSKEFTVLMPPAAEVTDDIRELIGLDCNVQVKVSTYSFTSKIARTKGTKINGTKFILSDISKHPKYTNRHEPNTTKFE